MSPRLSSELKQRLSDLFLMVSSFDFFLYTLQYFAKDLISATRHRKEI